MLKHKKGGCEVCTPFVQKADEAYSTGTEYASMNRSKRTRQESVEEENDIKKASLKKRDRDSARTTTLLKENA